MNVKEGMRRSALLLGAAGAIVGGFASYLELQTVLSQRARHNEFERLAASDIVSSEHNAWPLALRYAPKEAIESLRKLPESQQRSVIYTLTHDERADLLAKLKCAPSQWGVDSTATVQGSLSQIDPPIDYDALAKKYGGTTIRKSEDDPYACLAESSDPPASMPNKGGIKVIHWTRALGVESIETQDGQALYPTPAPSRLLYIIAVILPVLGFVLPWGLVRAVTWVGAGFFANVN
jgi:hypothetical protein